MTVSVFAVTLVFAASVCGMLALYCEREGDTINARALIVCCLLAAFTAGAYRAGT